jgi:hypothetical protein
MECELFWVCSLWEQLNGFCIYNISILTITLARDFDVNIGGVVGEAYSETLN